jgi:hypothetical protein
LELASEQGEIPTPSLQPWEWQLPVSTNVTFLAEQVLPYVAVLTLEIMSPFSHIGRRVTMPVSLSVEAHAVARATVWGVVAPGASCAVAAAQTLQLGSAEMQLGADSTSITFQACDGMGLPIQHNSRLQMSPAVSWLFSSEGRQWSRRICYCLSRSRTKALALSQSPSRREHRGCTPSCSFLVMSLPPAARDRWWSSAQVSSSQVPMASRACASLVVNLPMEHVRAAPLGTTSRGRAIRSASLAQRTRSRYPELWTLSTVCVRGAFIVILPCLNTFYGKVARRSVHVVPEVR